MWQEILSAASTVLGKGGSSGPTTVQSGAPVIIDASFDSSQWTVATGKSTARAENSKVDVPAAAAATLAAQSSAPYVDAGIMPTTAGVGGLNLQTVLPVVLLAAGLALVVRKKG